MSPIVLYGPTAQHLKPENGRTSDVVFDRFPSGESYCQIKDNIRGQDVFVVQSIANPANDSLMDLLVVGDAARRASAGRLTAVIPYMGYMRQDRKDKPRVPISAKLIVDMIECAGYDRIMTMDVHTLQAQGFTNIPFDHLFGHSIFIPFIADARHSWPWRNTKKPLVFVAPDIGAVKRTQSFQEAFEGSSLAIVNKKRLSPTQVEARAIIGDVKDMDAIIADDLTESCNTLIEAAIICREHGAATVRAAVTHAPLHAKGRENLAKAMTDGVFDEFITTDTLNTFPNLDHEPIEGYANEKRNITILPCGELFHRAIAYTNTNKSITHLFNVKGY